MYLYAHISPNKKMYIGITAQLPEKRWRKGDGYKRNTYFYNAIQKYGWDSFDHIILFSNLSDEKAKMLEEKYILKYDLMNPQKGYNLQSGGSHHRASEQTKRRISKSKKGLMIGEKNPFYGKHHTAETMAIINKKVEQYSVDGEYIKTYSSMRDACGANNIDPSELTKVCKGKRKTSGGYQWKYEKSDKIIKPYRRTTVNKKKVAKMNIESGHIIAIYDSLCSAGKKYGTNADKCIGDCCRGKQLSAYGYKWEYVK